MRFRVRNVFNGHVNNVTLKKFLLKVLALIYLIKIQFLINFCDGWMGGLMD